jgi:tripartite-type tricarboxylate transporter receptor subunit TctC
MTPKVVAPAVPGAEADKIVANRHHVAQDFRVSDSPMVVRSNVMLRRAGLGLVVLASDIAACAGFAPAVAQSAVETFYKGRTVEIAVGTNPGGSYDLYGRLIAPYLARHIPGHPAVIVKNMPGAGHLRMTNWLYNAAPRDGTVLGTASQAIAIEQALGSDGIQYDAAKFNWIGRVAASIEVTYTWHSSPTKTLDDARKRVTVMGATGPTSPSVFYLRALNSLAGTQFKIISGFPGGSNTELAMQRGEVEGGSKGWASMKADNAEWLREKKVNVLVQYALERVPELSHVPLMAELGHDDNARAALKLFAMGNAMGRSFMAAPGTPPERVAALRHAFSDTLKDPELIAFAAQRNIDIGLASGEDVHALVQQTLAVTPETVAMVKKARGD